MQTNQDNHPIAHIDNPDMLTHLIAGSGTRPLLPLIMPVLEDMGFALVRIRLNGIDTGKTAGKTKKSGGKVLQIMAENKSGSLTLGECEAISHALSALLDIEDPISGSYQLEISSAGIERPLTRLHDFETYKGARIKLKTARPITSDNKARSRFDGILCGIDKGEVLLELAVSGYSDPQILGFAFSQISEVSLHPDDMDMRVLLNAHKHMDKTDNTNTNTNIGEDYDNRN